MQKLVFFVLFLATALAAQPVADVGVMYQEVLLDIIVGRVQVDIPEFHQADILAKFYSGAKGDGDAWLMNRTKIWSQFADAGSTRTLRFPYDIRSLELLHPEYVVVVYFKNHNMCAIVKNALVDIATDCFDDAVVDIKVMYVGTLFQHIDGSVMKLEK